jgi:hypothetical protein
VSKKKRRASYIIVEEKLLKEKLMNKTSDDIIEGNTCSWSVAWRVVPVIGNHILNNVQIALYITTVIDYFLPRADYFLT